MGSIQVPAEERCAFCEYLSSRRPYTILRRGQLSSILVTREQRGRSHVLVVPNAHRRTVVDLQPQESCEIMTDIIAVARAIEIEEHARGIAVWQNNGLPADQAVPHVHFHVAATLAGGGTERGNVEELPIAATEAIADALRTHLLDSSQGQSKRVPQAAGERGPRTPRGPDAEGSEDSNTPVSRRVES